MAAKSEDSVSALQPRYWAARAAEKAGDTKLARSEFSAIAQSFPLSYYGWRARERLGEDDVGGTEKPARLARGTSRVPDDDLLRAALLLEAGLDDFAREELRVVAGRARGLADRQRVGRLLVEAGDYYRAHQLVVDAYSRPLHRGVQPGNEAVWWLSWPPAYRELVQTSLPDGAVIEPALVWAIMREESSYRPTVRSGAGAIGLLQLMPSTAEQVAERSGRQGFETNQLFDPATNVELGAVYLDELARRFPDRLSAAIGSYNAGPNAVSSWLRGEDGRRDDDAWVEDIPYDQTRAYVKRVLRSYHVYRRFYAEARAPQSARSAAGVPASP